jgi:protein ImuB
MDRLACVEVPALPLQVLRKLHPEWAGAPTAVVQEDKPQSPLTWVDLAARARGILPGMRYAAALALSTELRAGTVSPEAVSAAVAELSARLRRFTPHVEPAPGRPGTFVLDAGGLGGLWPSLAEWARQARAELAGAGFDAVVVVGFSRFGACALARSLAADPSGKRCLVLSSGQAETQAARRVRLDRLDLDPGARDALDRLGVSTVAQLVALPAKGLLERFGRELHDLHQQAAGRRAGSFHPDAPPEPVEARVDLDFPETSSGALFALAERMVPDLIARLARRGLDLESLAMRRTLDRGQGVLEDALPLAAPTRDAAQALDLVRLRLEATPLPAGVVALAIAARGVLVAGEQGTLLALRPRRDARAADRALARLRAELGEAAVVRARLRDGHLPEGQFTWERLDRLPAPRRRPGRPRAVRRLFERPRELPGTTGMRLVGPYLIEGGWWTGRPVQREYWFAETRTGAVLWIFHDRVRRRWVLQGAVE